MGPAGGARTRAVTASLWALGVLLVLTGVALARSRTYTSHALVAVDPVSLDPLVDPSLPPEPAAAAYERELARIAGPGVFPQALAQLDGEAGLRALRGPDGTIVLSARADSPGAAREAARVLAETYVADRAGGAAATAAADATVAQLTALGVAGDAATGAPPAGAATDVIAQVEDLQARLAAQRDGLARMQAGETAVLVGQPVPELGPAHLPLALVATGLLLAAVAAVRSVRPRPTTDPQPAGARGALALRLAARAGHRLDRRHLFVVSALVVGRAVVYGVAGVQFLADDWLIQANLDRFGPFGTADGLALSARALPVAWVTYNVAFGVAGDHPLLLLGVGTLANLVVAALLYAVLTRVFSDRVALAVTALWVLVPNHSALTSWGATIHARVALALLLAGVLTVIRGRAWWVAALCFVGASFSYELTLPVSLAAAVLLPSAGALSRRGRAAIVGALAVAVLWQRAAPHYPAALRVRSPLWVWSGHVGAGWFGRIDVPLPLQLALAGTVALGVVVAVSLWLRGERGWDDGPTVVVAGLVVMTLGLATLNLTDAVLGDSERLAADRLYAVSSMGAALVLVGLGLVVWRRRPGVAVVGAVAAVGLGLVGTVGSARVWADEGRAAARLFPALEAAGGTDPAATTFVLTPRDPWRRGVIGVYPVAADAAFHGRFGDGPGTVLFDDGGPPPQGAVVVDWADVRGGPLPEPVAGYLPALVWEDPRSAAEDTACTVLSVAAGDDC